VKFAPSPSTQCKNIPYNFHPMYATSSPQTTVPWAAATYNVAFDTEVGHFDYCSSVDVTTGGCVGNEGIGSNTEAADGDDFGCWPGSASGLIKIGACEGSNVGYDGTPAQFYPYYTTGAALGGCAWTVGQMYPGFSTNNYGAHQQYGQLLKVAYTGPGGVASFSYNDFQKNLPNNPSPR
jgi:hypothetical protein